MYPIILVGPSVLWVHHVIRAGHQAALEVGYESSIRITDPSRHAPQHKSAACSCEAETSQITISLLGFLGACICSSAFGRHLRSHTKFIRSSAVGYIKQNFSARPHHLTLPIVVMAVAMLHFLPQAPHMLWQTAASPFILPSSWQQMYKRCPRCGGNAPNVCDEVWPENWWEDDMLGLMYQGHIPPARRISPWEAYYSSYRVQYPPPASPQTPLRVDTHYPYYPQEAHMAIQAPMTPPQTPGVLTQLPYSTATRPLTPTSPTLRYSRQGTFSSVPSFDSVHGPTSQIIDFGTFRC